MTQRKTREYLKSVCPETSLLNWHSNKVTELGKRRATEGQGYWLLEGGLHLS